MIVAVSQYLAILLGVWLVGLSLFMLVSPHRALGALAAMGGSGLIHFGELGLRTLAGAALVLAASASKAPTLIGVVGWFLIVSALAIMIAPRRWHTGYSAYRARRIPVTAVRLPAPASAIAGGALV